MGIFPQTLSKTKPVSAGQGGLFLSHLIWWLPSGSVGPGVHSQVRLIHYRPGPAHTRQAGSHPALGSLGMASSGGLSRLQSFCVSPRIGVNWSTWLKPPAGLCSAAAAMTPDPRHCQCLPSLSIEGSIWLLGADTFLGTSLTDGCGREGIMAVGRGQAL